MRRYPLLSLFILVICNFRYTDALTFGHRQAGSMYKNVKKKIERGIAFPTCISVNNTVCHFSPLASDETVLAEGDVVKM